MKKRGLKPLISIIVCFIIICSISVASGCGSVRYYELGIPLESRFSQGIYARTAWDMKVWDNKLYIGSGDYNLNKGPTDIWCYDLLTKTWVNSGRVEDESVLRFCVINGKLVAPGIDPKDVKWDDGVPFFGNYYMLEDGEWKTFNNLPATIHNFDMLESGGKIFAALGVESGSKAVACSVDGGKTFTAIQMKKGVQPVDTAGSEFIRVYELFELNGDVYALLRYGKDWSKYEIYRYDGTDFVFFSDWTDKFFGGQVTFNFFSSKVNFKGKIFFSYGNLFVTDDMENVSQVVVDKGAVYCDMFVDGQELYLLTAKKSNTKYLITVWKNDSGETDGFRELFSFRYDIPVLSFAYDGESFYFGAGSISNVHDKNGMILTVKYPK